MIACGVVWPASRGVAAVLIDSAGRARSFHLRAWDSK